jgi:hypothetical protein
MSATCPAHLIFLDLFILIIFIEDISSLFSFFQLDSFLLNLNIKTVDNVAIVGIFFFSPNLFGVVAVQDLLLF